MRNLHHIIVVLVITLFTSMKVHGQDTMTCPEGSAELVVATGAVGRELEVTMTLFDQFMELCPNILVGPLEVPEQSTDRLGLYIQFLGTRTEAVDIYQVDVIWPSIIDEHMVDLYEYFPADSEDITQHFPAIIENNTVEGRLIGLPWFTDAGLMYYRTDLLEKYDLDVPATWDELENAARVIQEGERAEGQDEFWGYLWQGDLGEPTTISALEWQASNNGGVIISPEGEIQVNNPETIAAIERAAAWIGDISPPTVIGHRPGDSLDIWREGNAAFMRNWPFAYNLSNAKDSAIAGQFDVMPLPSGDDGERTGTLGGWQLAVSQYSRYPDAAVALVRFLASPESQKYRAVELGNAPTIQQLYEDEEVLKVAQFFDSLSEALQTAVARPSTIAGDRYNDVSRLYSEAVHSVLTGDEDARTAMEDLEFDLEDLLLDS